MPKAPNARMVCYFPAENGVDRVEKAGFSRADLTKKKDVCNSDV